MKTILNILGIIIVLIFSTILYFAFQIWINYFKYMSESFDSYSKRFNN